MMKSRYLLSLLLLLFIYNISGMGICQGDQFKEQDSVYLNSSENGSPDRVVSDKPFFRILDARMVSPENLGIAAEITYPAARLTSATRTVTFSANINNCTVIKTIDISTITPQPGTPYIIGLDKHGEIDPATPLFMNLREEGVTRFTDNIEFLLSGTAQCGDGEDSDESDKQISILLPVVVLHGYTPSINPLLIPVPGMDQVPVKGYPAMNTDAPSCAESANNVFYRAVFYEYAYKGLAGTLKKSGYVSFEKGEDDYITLWDPGNPDISYSSPSFATLENLDNDFNRIYSKIVKTSFASKFNLIGHSTGGLVGRYWASKNPDTLNRIITVGTPHEGICRFYEEPFSEKYFSREDYTQKEMTYNNNPNLLTWFVPRWEGAVQYIQGAGPDPLWENSFNYGFTNANYYLIYKDSNEKTDKDVKISLRPDKTWYDETISGRTYGRGDGFVYAMSASANSTGPAESSTFHRIPVATENDHEQLCVDPKVMKEIILCLSDNP